MVKRFEIWSPRRLSNAVSEEAIQARDTLKSGADQLLNQVKDLIVNRPALMLSAAVFCGVVLGCLIKRR